MDGFYYSLAFLDPSDNHRTYGKSSEYHSSANVTSFHLRSSNLFSGVHFQMYVAQAKKLLAKWYGLLEQKEGGTIFKNQLLAPPGALTAYLPYL